MNSLLSKFRSLLLYLLLPVGDTIGTIIEEPIRIGKGLKRGRGSRKGERIFSFKHRSIKTWQPAVMGKIHNMIKLGCRHV